MPGKVFWNTLRYGRRGAVYWAMGLAVYAMYIAILVPDTEQLKGYVDLMKALPPAMMQVMGVTDVNVFATVGGFIGFAYFTYSIIMLSIYAVLAGLNITANDEESGVMNMLLSLPLPRWRVAAERAAAYTLMMLAVVFGGWLGLIGGKLFNPFLAGLDAFTLLQANFASVPTALTVMGVTAVLGVVIRRRNVAGALAGGFVAASYLLNTLASAAGPGIGETLQKFSIFYYFDGVDLAQNGLNPGAFVLLSLIAAGLAFVTVRVFERRDISA